MAWQQHQTGVQRVWAGLKGSGQDSGPGIEGVERTGRAGQRIEDRYEDVSLRKRTKSGEINTSQKMEICKRLPMKYIKSRRGDQYARKVIEKIIDYKVKEEPRKQREQ